MKTRVWYFCFVLVGSIAVAADDLTSTIFIESTDAQAVEASGDTGIFTVRRVGGTNFSQLIFYELSGIASNGVDYEQLGGTVQMPAGATAASITIRPIRDSLSEGTETVVARIVPSPLDCVTCGYDIGNPDRAEIVIDDIVIDPRNGLYQIDSGTYHACCGFAGNDLGYPLPAVSQSFVRLFVDPQNNTAMMTFLDEAQSVFMEVPCPSGPSILFGFSHGLVFSNRLVFHVDPGPVSYWNYTVSNSVNQIRIDGILGLTGPTCSDTPRDFRHSNVVATLVVPPPRIDGVQRQGDLLRFQFSGEAPYDYFVEYTEKLVPPNWQSLTNFRAKINPILATVTDPLSNSAARFYRIRKQRCLCRTEP